MKYTIFILFFILLSSCYSHKRAVESSKPYSDQIRWPAEYNPSEANFFVHNVIDIQASPEVVWDLLIRAEEWPAWYEGMTNVKVKGTEDGILYDQAEIEFRTMGLNFVATVREFEPPSRLSWESTRKDIQGYHSWLIIPTETGCTLVTDEPQKGFLTFMEKVFQPNKLRKLHDEWLAGFKEKAEMKVNR